MGATRSRSADCGARVLRSYGWAGGVLHARSADAWDGGATRCTTRGLPSHRRSRADSNGTMFIGCMAAGSQAARHSLPSAGWGLKVQPHPHESEPHVSRAVRGKCWGDFFHRSIGGYIIPTCRDLLPGRLRRRARARGRAGWLGGGAGFGLLVGLCCESACLAAWLELVLLLGRFCRLRARVPFRPS